MKILLIKNMPNGDESKVVLTSESFQVSSNSRLIFIVLINFEEKICIVSLLMLINDSYDLFIFREFDENHIELSIYCSQPGPSFCVLS